MPLPHPIPDSSRLLCYVTDRKQLGAAASASSTEPLLRKITEAATAGVDWIQIREADLSTAVLTALVEEARRRVPSSCRILVNDRLDVACAVGAGGVHLGEKSISVADAQRFVREWDSAKDFRIGASVHSLEAARAAEAAGAAYLIFGPVFFTPSKISFGPPQGLDKLAEVCSSVSLPVLAIGGITPENAAGCYAHGARGVAAIGIFQQARDILAIVKRLRV